jgi:hypothetical protein
MKTMNGIHRMKPAANLRAARANCCFPGNKRKQQRPGFRRCIEAQNGCGLLRKLHKSGVDRGELSCMSAELGFKIGRRI